MTLTFTHLTGFCRRCSLVEIEAVQSKAELTAAEFAATIQAHPTLSEAWMEAAHAVHGLCIHAPPRRR